METAELARHWESNARAWSLLTRKGYDVSRDRLNTPAFLDLLPDIDGLCGLDIGCGDGSNTRRLADRGATLTAIDISPTFLRFAGENNPRGLDRVAGDATRLPFRSGQFAFATAFMSLMDVSTPEQALREACRVLQPGGFLQFSILHPCFAPPYRKLVRDESGAVTAVEVGRYFDGVDGEIERWIFCAAPKEESGQFPLFAVPRFHRTLSQWVDGMVDAGLVLEKMAEPFVDEETARRIPSLADTRVCPFFLHVRCRKPR